METLAHWGYHSLKIHHRFIYHKFFGIHLVISHCQSVAVMQACASGSVEVLSVQLATYLLTPRNRVLLEKLTGFAANQEIPRILWNP